MLYAQANSAPSEFEELPQQLFSLLPTSYPGHNILTEDIGEIIKEDNCKCDIQEKHFLVHGRAKEAEIRGCSDVR